jgi:hypothetical protein
VVLSSSFFLLFSGESCYYRRNHKRAPTVNMYPFENIFFRAGQSWPA